MQAAILVLKLGLLRFAPAMATLLAGKIVTGFDVRSAANTWQKDRFNMDILSLLIDNFDFAGVAFGAVTLGCAAAFEGKVHPHHEHNNDSEPKGDVYTHVNNSLLNAYGRCVMLLIWYNGLHRHSIGCR